MILAAGVDAHECNRVTRARVDVHDVEHHAERRTAARPVPQRPPQHRPQRQQLGLHALGHMQPGQHGLGRQAAFQRLGSRRRAPRVAGGLGSLELGLVAPSLNLTPLPKTLAPLAGGGQLDEAAGRADAAEDGHGGFSARRGLGVEPDACIRGRTFVLLVGKALGRGRP